MREHINQFDAFALVQDLVPHPTKIDNIFFGFKSLYPALAEVVMFSK
jgi:hypothetical protein